MALGVYDTSGLQPGQSMISSTYTSGGGSKSTVPKAPTVPNIAAPTSVVTPAVIGKKYGKETTPPQLVTNPFAPAAISSAQAAGNAATGQGQNNFDTAALLRSMAGQGAGAAGQVLNTGFDPQQALYNRTAQQLQDQIRVGQAARGTTMSPYGAGQEAGAMSNFNIDWQNNQLARQTQALQAFGGYGGQASGMGTGAANIGQQGVAQTQMQGQLPYAQSQNNQANDINNWLAIISAGQTNYPLTLAQKSMENAGGVPYIPQNSTNISF